MDEQKFRVAEDALWASFGVRPKERFVVLATTNTTVRVLETGEGQPTLFIHGGPNAGSTWAPLVGHLEGMRCLIVDRPGTGLSEPWAITDDNFSHLAASFVGDVLDGLGLERAHVVASSFGGHLALRSAAAHPERFERMVQMAAPAAVPGMTLPRFMASLTSAVVRWLVRTLPPSRRMNREIFRQIGHGASLDAGRIPDEVMEWYLALGQHTDTFRHDPEMIGSVLLPNLDALTLGPELLGSVQVPTLFLWGSDDAFGDEENARHVAGLLPDADLVMLPDAGHLPWLDAPDVVARAMMAFLGDPRWRPGRASAAVHD